MFAAGFEAATSPLLSLSALFALPQNRIPRQEGMVTPIGQGVRVVRGPDWRWDDQDGGEGFTGTVAEICGPGAASPIGRASQENTVIVQWDGGSRTNYRVGFQDAYDLRVIDNAQIGKSFHLVMLFSS